MNWKKIYNERTWSFGPGGSHDSSNWMGGGSSKPSFKISVGSSDPYSKAKRNVNAVVSGGRIMIDSLNLTNTRHQELDRRDRDASIDNEAGGLGKEVLAVYFVDKGHPAGPELHWITDNAIILVTNAFKNNGLNVNTKLTARPGQLYRYPEGGNQNMLSCQQVFPSRDWQVPQSLISKAKKNQEMGLNYRESTNMKWKLCKEEIDLGWDYEARRDCRDMAQRTREMDLAKKVIFNGEPMTKEQAIKKTRQMFFIYEIEHPEASMASALSKVKAMKDGDEIEVKPSDFDLESYQENKQIDESRLDDIELEELANEFVNARLALDRGEGTRQREEMAFNRLAEWLETNGVLAAEGTLFNVATGKEGGYEYGDAVEDRQEIGWEETIAELKSEPGLGRRILKVLDNDPKLMQKVKDAVYDAIAEKTAKGDDDNFSKSRKVARDTIMDMYKSLGKVRIPRKPKFRRVK